MAGVEPAGRSPHEPTAAGGRAAGWGVGALGLLLGMAWQVQQPTVASPWVSLGAALPLLVWLGAAWCRGPRRRGAAQLAVVPVVAVVAVIALAAGWGWAGWRAHLRLADTLAPELEGVDLVLTGRIDGLPVQRVDGVRFLFEVEGAQREGRAVTVPPQVRLGWFRPAVADAAVVPGERWRFTVRLRRPNGAVNPDGFDTELWLFEQGLRATGAVREGRARAPPLRLAEASGHWVDRARLAVRQRIVATLGATPAAALLSALSVGDQAAIGREAWAVFRATGVTHLVAISGLHVTLFAWLAGGGVGWLWGRSARALLCCPRAVAGRWAGVLAAAGYAVLAGWAVPAQRTVYMLLIAAAARSAGLRWPWPLTVAGAALVVCLVDPWALLQPGFWLSFVAVAVLMADGGARPMSPVAPGARPVWHHAWQVAWGGVRTQWLVTAALAPLTLVCFQQLSVAGLLANLVAIPVVTFVLTPLALLGVVVPLLWAWGAACAAWALQALAALAAWPGALWEAPAPPPWVLVSAALGAGVVAWPWPLRLRAVGAGLLLPLLAPPPLDLPVGAADVLVADVGQGTAVLVRTAGHALLYDAGSLFGPDSDAGSQILVPLLRAQGVSRLDLLVLSHRDTDHVGGAASVLTAVPTVRVTSSLEAGHPLRQRVPHQPCAAGQRWVWDGVAFEVLHPREAEPLPGTAPRPNARSCVLRLTTAGGSVLLTGDIEHDQELALLLRRAPLRADVLLVPHHGSRTSSSAPWLDAVQPRWAVVQAGYLNRFGHPAPDVLERYRERRINIVRTDQCGAWRWRSTGEAPTCERAVHPHYWQRPVWRDGESTEDEPVLE